MISSRPAPSHLEPPTKKPTVASLGVVVADAVYPQPVFMALTGLGAKALREARERGLKVCQVGNRRYVRGADWLQFLGEQAK